MSDHFLVVIPADPKAELPGSAAALRDELARIAGTNEARIKDYGKLQFIDCGENYERIGCPNCGTEITIPQWHEWMDEDWHCEEGFHLHWHVTPCCETKLTLNDLVYEWPQGFAHWFVGARNPGRGPLAADDVTALEEVAGLRLKAIAQMY